MLYYPLTGLLSNDSEVYSTSCYKCNIHRCPLIPFVSRPCNGYRCCTSLHMDTRVRFVSRVDKGGTIATRKVTRSPAALGQYTQYTLHPWRCATIKSSFPQPRPAVAPLQRPVRKVKKRLDVPQRCVPPMHYGIPLKFVAPLRYYSMY